MAVGPGALAWELYKDVAGKFRWRCKASNGNIIYASSEGYVNRAFCITNATNLGFVESNMEDLTKDS